MAFDIGKIFRRDPAHYDGVRRINIYLLRALYALMFFMLGQTCWTEIFTHQGPWEPNEAMAWSVWTGFSVLAGLGIRVMVDVPESVAAYLNDPANHKGGA